MWYGEQLRVLRICHVRGSILDSDWITVCKLPANNVSVKPCLTRKGHVDVSVESEQSRPYRIQDVSERQLKALTPQTPVNRTKVYIVFNVGTPFFSAPPLFQLTMVRSALLKCLLVAKCGNLRFVMAPACCNVRQSNACSVETSVTS